MKQANSESRIPSRIESLNVALCHKLFHKDKPESEEELQLLQSTLGLIHVGDPETIRKYGDEEMKKRFNVE